MTQFEVIHIEETDSTNRWLRESALPVTPERGLCVVADYQTAGRGQGTNRWESQAGQNLTFSLGFGLNFSRCEVRGTRYVNSSRYEVRGTRYVNFVRAKEQFIISMAIAVSIVRTLESFLLPASSVLLTRKNMAPQQSITIKWPNDIYVGYRKVCGILIECRLQGEWVKDCIAGIGLNVNQRRFLSDAPNPTSMAIESGQDFDRDEVLRVLLEHFSQTLESWDEAAIRSAYRSLLYRREGYWPYSDGEGCFEARLKDVEDDGHLVLEDRAGRERRYAFKEVVFLHSHLAPRTSHLDSYQVIF